MAIQSNISQLTDYDLPKPRTTNTSNPISYKTVQSTGVRVASINPESGIVRLSINGTLSVLRIESIYSVKKVSIEEISQMLGISPQAWEVVQLQSVINKMPNILIGPDTTDIIVYETNDGYILDNGEQILYGKN